MSLIGTVICIAIAFLSSILVCTLHPLRATSSFLPFVYLSLSLPLSSALLILDGPPFIIIIIILCYYSIATVCGRVDGRV